MHVLLGDLEKRRHRGRNLRGLRVPDGASGRDGAVGLRDRVQQEERVILDVVALPEHLVPRDLLGDEDRLLDGRERRDLRELRALHVRDALRVFREANVPVRALDVVDEAPLGVRDDDRDVRACDVAVVLEHAPAGEDVLVNAALLAATLRELDGARAREHLLEVLVGVEVLARVDLLRAVEQAEDALHLDLLLDAVVLGDVDDGRAAPVEVGALHFLRPRRRVVAVGVAVRGERHRRDDEAVARVALVEALRLEVEEDRRVRVEDRLDADALLVVLRVELVLERRAKTPGADASEHRLLEGVVVRLVGDRLVLVGAVEAIAEVGELVVLAVLRHEVDRDAVRSVLGNDALHRDRDLVHFEARLVFELALKRAFPLRARDRREASVLETLAPLVLERRLNLVELDERVFVDSREALGLAFGHGGDGITDAKRAPWGRRSPRRRASARRSCAPIRRRSAGRR